MSGETSPVKRHERSANANSARTMAFRSALVKERSALELRLRSINALLQGDVPPPLALDGEEAGSPAFLDMFAESVGLQPETVRLLMVVALLVFLWARGRAIAHAVGVLFISAMLTIWAMGRIVLRRLGLSKKQE